MSSTRSVWVCLTVLMAMTGTAYGQTGNTVENTSVEPIECWWRTSVSAVRLGEPFTVVLTCSVLDTTATTVVPDQTRLDASVLQLQPFEVMSGAHAADVRTSARRFFQYEYAVRYMGEEFGRDLPIPPLTITYRVQSRVDDQAAAIESRDRQYLMPSQLIRVVSLVPTTATDIREPAPDTFRMIEARQFRANVLRIASYVLFGLAGLMALWGLVRALGSRRQRTQTTTAQLVSDGTILSTAVRALDDVGQERRGTEWTPELAARALTALRVAGAYAGSGSAIQTPWEGTGEPAPGQIAVRGRLRPGRRVLVSGAATAVTLEREMRRVGHLNGQGGALSDLHDALGRFTTAVYGQADSKALDLDDALESGRRGADAVKRSHGWLALRLKALGRAAKESRARSWGR